MRTVTADRLIALEREGRYKRQLADSDVFPDGRNWDYIISNTMTSIAPELYRKYLLAWLTPDGQRSDFHILALERFPEYLGALPRHIAVTVVYSDIHSAPEGTLFLINTCNLFDAVRLTELLEEDSDPHFVAQCMEALQPEYNTDDVRNMCLLLDAMRTLPKVGNIKESYSIFGTDRRVVCPNGHTGPAQSTDDGMYFCKTCGMNLQGLTRDDLDVLKAFENRIRLLRQELTE